MKVYHGRRVGQACSKYCICLTPWILLGHGCPDLLNIAAAYDSFQKFASPKHRRIVCPMYLSTRSDRGTIVIYLFQL
jgi:hypothetical protein